ncbi:MAG: APC family permease [Thermoanaerobaculia bacterium]
MSEPRETLGATDAVAVIVGIVVGAAIFESPSWVAASAGSATAIVLAWILGGFVSLVGALCYAELASAWPHPGGDYHYLTRAFGSWVGFLFAWARMSVIQTGSIALLAFVFGDYMSQIVRIGPYSAAIYAAAAVLVLTALNVSGINPTRHSQKWLTAAQVGGLALLIAAALVAPATAVGPPAAGEGASASAFGLVMVFVLLTYGGCIEAAYISAELREGRRRMAPVLVVSIGIVTVLYVGFNLALLRLMGAGGMARSEAVGADLTRIVAGERGAILISALIAASALTSANAVILTGGRSSFAMGRDFRLFARIGVWDAVRGTPRNALVLQGAIALALVVFGSVTRKGFKTMVDYTAPVFWLFFLLAAVSLFILRRREPAAPRPFRVPFYPVTPALFVMTCAWLLWSSLAYTGIGAAAGVGVLLVGLVLIFVDR